MSFAKTIAYVEAQAEEVANRNGHWSAHWQRNWIVEYLIKIHHWQALEEFLARPDEMTYPERIAAQSPRSCGRASGSTVSFSANSLETTHDPSR